MKSITYYNDRTTVADLDDMRAFLEQAVLWLGGSDDIAGDLVLGVNEAVTNVILHGYGGLPDEVTIEVTDAGGDLIVRLLDRAPLFDPTIVPPPDIYRPLEDRPLGGLGVHMMRQLCDELKYRIRPGGGNELSFIKSAAFSQPD